MAFAPPWLDEHMLGFVTECEESTILATSPESPTGKDGLPARSAAQHLTAQRALRHYKDSLALRPNSFWGCYRAAAICNGLGQVKDATLYLEKCLNQRPENITLQGQLAGCLIHLKRYYEALPLCDQVLSKAPDLAEFYRTRSFVSAKLGQTSGLAEDIRHFEIRKSVIPQSFWDSVAIENPNFDRMTSRSALDLDRYSQGYGPIYKSGDFDPEESDKRATLAREIANAGAFELYQRETDKILFLDPDHFPARTMRVEQAIHTAQFDLARRELQTILENPRLMEYLNRSVDSLKPFRNITQLYLQAGRVDDALTVARSAKDLAYSLKRDIGWSQFYLAEVYAMKARTDPSYIEPAANSLYIAFHANPDFKQWYQGRNRSNSQTTAKEQRRINEPIPARFDPVRPRIDAELRRKEEQSAEDRRRLAPPNSKKE